MSGKYPNTWTVVYVAFIFNEKSIFSRNDFFIVIQCFSENYLIES